MGLAWANIGPAALPGVLERGEPGTPWMVWGKCLWAPVSGSNSLEPAAAATTPEHRDEERDSRSRVSSFFASSADFKPLQANSSGLSASRRLSTLSRHWRMHSSFFRISAFEFKLSPSGPSEPRLRNKVIFKILPPDWIAKAKSESSLNVMRSPSSSLYFMRISSVVFSFPLNTRCIIKISSS